MADIRALLALAVPYRAALVGSVLLMLGESGAALAVPWLAGRLAESVLPTGMNGVANIRWVLLGMFALFAAQALLKFANVHWLGGTAERVVADLKVRLYDHLQALPLSFFQRRRHGDTLALLTHDVHVVSDFVSGTVPAIAPLLLTASGAVLLMFGIQPGLALVAGILISLFYLAMKVFGRRMRLLATQLQEEHATAVVIAEENLGMLPAIKTFTRERQESLRYRRQIDRIVQLSARQRKVYAALGPAVQLVAATGIVAVLWLASAELTSGGLAPAQLVSFLLYAQLLTRPVSGLADVYGQTQGARGALARLRQAMDEPSEPAAHVGTKLPPVNGDIEFRGVSFGYPGRPPALVGVNLHVPAGQTLAIVGPNGAGKSTLAHLLTRLHEPAEGTITVDGVDIATVSLHSLRSQIGVVPQHVLLFNASVRDNIAYGRPEPAAAEIEAAARAARAHDFVMQLPHGYDTLIGDRGVRLSGGQQQRIALARALLKDPPILILDEATAMFDPQGEIEFLAACRGVLKERTVLLITHRPASLAVADATIHIDGGKIRSLRGRSIAAAD